MLVNSNGPINNVREQMYKRQYKAYHQAELFIARKSMKSQGASWEILNGTAD